MTYITNQSSSAFSSLLGPTNNDIPFHTWIHWQWSWFLENCQTILQNIQQHLRNHHYNLIGIYENLISVIRQKCLQLQSLLSYQVIQQYLSSVDQSHIYFLLSGIAIGFLVGIHVKQNTKPLPRMRALVCNSYKGAEESLAVIDDMIAPFSCAAEEVLIQVKAASIDPIDIKITFGFGKVIRRQYHQYHKVIYQ